MAVAGGAVGGDEGGLAAAPGTAAALGVIGRGGRHVTHHDGVERGDVDAQFHRRGAVEQLEFRLAEGFLPFPPLLGVDLRGVLAGEEAGQAVGRFAVEPTEEDVDTRAVTTRVRAGEVIVSAGLARTGPPDDGGCRHPVAGGGRRRPAEAPGLLRCHGHLGHEPGVLEDLQQILDDRLEIRLVHVLVEPAMRTSQILPVLPPRRQEKSRTVHPGLRGLGVSGGNLGSVALGEPPGVHEAFLAGALERVEVVAEVLHVDGE